MPTHHCLLPCTSCAEIQFVPASTTLVVRAGGKAVIAWACPKCQCGRMTSVTGGQGDEAIENGARSSGLATVTFRQCGGCDTISAVPFRDFTVFTGGTAPIAEWSCHACTCTNSYPITPEMKAVLAAHGAVDLDLNRLTEDAR